MRSLPEIPDDDVAEYWQLVRAALVAGGLSKKDATATAKAYREYMRPAGWTIYNRDPEDSAEMAKSYAAWMQKEEQEKTGLEVKAAPKRAKKPAKNANRLPTEVEITGLPRWARVAFAARCARRVEPLFLKHWPTAPQEHVLAVRHAVEVAEQSAGAAAFDFDDALAIALAAAGNAADASGNAAYASGDAAYIAYIADAGDFAAAAAAARSAGPWAIPIIRQDFEQVLAESQRRQWTDSTPVPSSVFGPLWPDGPPADWPELPKPAKLKLSVQVPDGLDDAAAREKLQKLTAALARLNIVGGGHGLELVRPIVFTQEQERGRADVVEQEGTKAKGRGHSQGGR